MRLFILILSLGFASKAHSQIDEDIPFVGYFGGYGKDIILMNDSVGYLFIPFIDTNIVVFISKKYTDYKMYDRNSRLILEGDVGGRIYRDYFKRFGKWTAYYPETGKPKVTGYYYADLPIGLWSYFYPNGQLKKTFTVSQVWSDSMYQTCKVGFYEEYYESGSVKITGFYKIVADSTEYDFNLGGFKSRDVKTAVSKPFGIWQYFKVDGKLDRKEEYY